MRFKEKYHLWILTSLYFLFRLPLLTRLPIFNDEAIYLDWANRIIQGSVPAFYSLYDGTQPLLLWIFGVFTNVFSDPLFAGRLVSVLAGLATMFGLYVLSKSLFRKKVAITASLLYIITPLFTFYDRQALMEASVSALGIWSLYFLVRYLEEWKLRFAVLIGILIGIGFFIKTSAAIFIIPTLVIGFIAFIKYPKRREQLLLGLFVLSSFFLLTIFPLVTQDQAKVIFSGSNRYVLTFAELLALPLKTWLDNLRSLLTILLLYVFPTTFLALTFGIWMSFRKSMKDSEKWIYIWLFVSLISVTFVAKSLPSRYIVSFLPLVVIPSAVTLVYLFKRLGKIVLVLGISIPLVATLVFYFKPRSFLEALSKIETTADIKTYVYGFSSGYGIEETRIFLEEKAKEGPILVGVRLDSGNPESAILTYYGFNKKQNIEAIYFDQQLLEIPDDVEFIDAPVPLYFISRGGQLAGLDKYLIEITRFYKPDNVDYIGIYTLREAEDI